MWKFDGSKKSCRVHNGCAPKVALQTVSSLRSSSTTRSLKEEVRTKKVQRQDEERKKFKGTKKQRKLIR